MTLPFENDTNSFIKKLASAQLKKERLKKIFTIVAISLATFLMASVLLLVSGIITVNQNGGNNITGSYHALISSIEKEQYQKLSDDVRVDLCGFTQLLLVVLNLEKIVLIFRIPTMMHLH